MEEKQYYRLLGVPRDASLKDIKKAYQVLSKKYNPAKNPGNEDWAQKRKLEVIEAYDILSNPATRAQYDEQAKAPAVPATRPAIITRNSALPVKPARVRQAAANKKGPGEEDREVSKRQKALEEKRKKRNTIITVSAISSIVIVAVAVAIFLVMVLPFQRVVIQVDNQTIKMDYFIRRVLMNTSGDAFSTIQPLVNELILSQEAPTYVGFVTDADIDADMRTTAQGTATSFSDAEYQNWLRTQLNNTQLSLAQLRNLFKLNLLQQRMYDYLAAQVPNTASQMHVFEMGITTYDEAVAAKARIDNGEDFSVVAKELSLYSGAATDGGDVGWWPIDLLPAQIKNSVTNLKVGVCSDPIALTNGTDPDTGAPAVSSYDLLMFKELADNMELTAEQLTGMQNVAYQNWMDQMNTNKNISFHGIRGGTFDSETKAWIDYQVARLKKGIKTPPTTATTTTPTLPTETTTETTTTTTPATTTETSAPTTTATTSATTTGGP